MLHEDIRRWASFTWSLKWWIIGMETNTPMQVGIKLHRFFNVLLWMHYNIVQAILLICTSLPGQPKWTVRTGDTEHDHPLSHAHILVMSDKGQLSRCNILLKGKVRVRSWICSCTYSGWEDTKWFRFFTKPERSAYSSHYGCGSD